MNERRFERVRRGVYRLIEKADKENQILRNQIEDDLKSLADEESAVEGGKKATYCVL